MIRLKEKDNKTIQIKQNKTADTRTCNVNEVSIGVLKESSEQHIGDVIKGLNLLSNKLKDIAIIHDRTKISHIENFYKDFKVNFETTDWWEFHQKEERHHFNNDLYIQEDVNLLDVLEQIVDCVMAGLARSGEYRIEPLSNELLQKAYKNTAEMLIKEVEVI